MTQEFDAAALGRNSGAGFAFDGDKDAIAAALHVLADDIKTGRAAIIKVHSGQSLTPSEFALRSVLIRYATRITP